MRTADGVRGTAVDTKSHPRCNPRVSATPSSEVTEILKALEEGSSTDAESRLWDLVYDELRSAAAKLVRGERHSATLQPTALVNDVYLRLFGSSTQPTWENRRHFFGAALRAMRHLLIDRGRRQANQRHQAGWPVTLQPSSDGAREDVMADSVLLAESLDQLEAHDERVAQVVMLRFFAGLDHKDIARALDVSLPTVKRDWAYGRSWLYANMKS